MWKNNSVNRKHVFFGLAILFLLIDLVFLGINVWESLLLRVVCLVYTLSCLVIVYFKSVSVLGEGFAYRGDDADEILDLVRHFRAYKVLEYSLVLSAVVMVPLMASGQLVGISSAVFVIGVLCILGNFKETRPKSLREVQIESIVSKFTGKTFVIKSYRIFGCKDGVGFVVTDGYRIRYFRHSVADEFQPDAKFEFKFRRVEQVDGWTAIFIDLYYGEQILKSAPF